MRHFRHPRVASDGSFSTETRRIPTAEARFDACETEALPGRRSFEARRDGRASFRDRFGVLRATGKNEGSEGRLRTINDARGRFKDRSRMGIQRAGRESSKAGREGSIRPSKGTRPNFARGHQQPNLGNGRGACVDGASAAMHRMAPSAFHDMKRVDRDREKCMVVHRRLQNHPAWHDPILYQQRIAHDSHAIALRLRS